VRRNIAMPFGMEKLEWRGAGEKKFVDMCDDSDNGDVIKSTIMNFNDYKSKISKIYLYSK